MVIKKEVNTKSRKKGVIIFMIGEKTCPKCGKEMTRIREENTFDGVLSAYYVCYECGYEESKE